MSGAGDVQFLSGSGSATCLAVVSLNLSRSVSRLMHRLSFDGVPTHLVVPGYVLHLDVSGVVTRHLSGVVVLVCPSASGVLHCLTVPLPGPQMAVVGASWRPFVIGTGRHIAVPISMRYWSAACASVVGWHGSGLAHFLAMGCASLSWVELRSTIVFNYC